MTLQEFIKKYTNKAVDFDGFYGTQCMDLMHFYVYEVLGLKDKSILAAPSAKQVYRNFKWDQYFEKIDNTPTGVPKYGDIVFWGGGEWGHVAIFITGDINDFTSFDANYPVGSLPHEQYHTYDNVLGWLRYKPQEEDDECKKRIKVLENNLENKIDELIAVKAELDKSLQSYKALESSTSNSIKQKDIDYMLLQKSFSEQSLESQEAHIRYESILTECKAKVTVLEDELEGYRNEKDGRRLASFDSKRLASELLNRLLGR